MDLSKRARDSTSIRRWRWLLLTPAWLAGVSAFAQPVASPVPLSSQVDTSATLNLAPFIAGAGITGIAIASAPAHGSASVNGTNVTYTPSPGYFGSDSFSYIAFGVGGASAPATVTVTVSGRPQPAADRAVAGMLAAQAETARRFSSTQISNFQRRLESLRRPPAAEADPEIRQTGDARGRTRADNTLASSQGMLVHGNGPSQRYQDAPVPLSLNLAAVAQASRGDRANAASGSPNFWIDGTLGFGTRDATAGRNGLEFRSDGVSFGVDRRINEKLVAGLGGGFGRDRTDIGADGTQNRAQSYSVSAYASYQPAPNLFVDALLGLGLLDIDTRRFVAPANAYAQGTRRGQQMFASVTAGYEHRDGAMLLSPYARLDAFGDRFRNHVEAGAGPYALAYAGETSRSARAALGARAELVRATDFGWVVPRMRVELQHDFRGDNANSVSYADLAGGPRSTVPIGGPARDAVVLGLGSDFVRRDGWALGVDYQLAHSFSNDTNHAIRFRISKDLDSSGPSALSGISLPHARPIGLQVDAGYLFDDNVTRSRTPGEKLHDSVYSANVSRSDVYPLTANTRAIMTWSAGGEKFQTYDGLSRLIASVRAEFQYRPSAEWDAPTYAVFGRMLGEVYESTIRNGFRYTAGLSVRKPLTDRIGAFAALSHNERYGNSSVFVNRDNSARFNLDYALSKSETIYLGAEYRRGDIVSTGGPSLENINIAKVLVPDDAFPGRQFFSYRLAANTVLATVGYNIGFGPKDALDFSWRRVESTPHERAFFATSPQSYIVNQYSITYLMRF